MSRDVEVVEDGSRGIGERVLGDVVVPGEPEPRMAEHAHRIHHVARHRAVAEALARGLPVISTGTGGIAEMLRHGGGTIVSTGDPGALASAIEAWFRLPPARDAMRAD